MRNVFLAIGFLISVFLSLYLGYREGLETGFQYTEKVSDVDHATGLMRTRYESAFNSYACFLKLVEAEKNNDIVGVKNDVRESALYSINGFREQVDQIRNAKINYPLVEIYESQINDMEMVLLK